MKMYKVAVIGCGRIAGHNCRAIENSEGLALVAVCDLEIMPLIKSSNAEMINILGFEIEKYRKKVYEKNEIFFDYLKKEAKDKRKMGHLTTLKD